MLGITLADAVVLTPIILAIWAAWRGTTSGEAARAAGASGMVATNIAMGIADGAKADGLTQAIIGLTDAVNGASRAVHDEALRENGDVLKQILEQLRANQTRR